MAQTQIVVGRLLAAASLGGRAVGAGISLEPAGGLSPTDVGTTILTAARASGTMNTACLTLLPI